MAAPPAPRPVLGVVLLLFVSAAWGSAFPLTKDLIVRMPVADLLAERYAIATLALVAMRPRCLVRLPRRTWLVGVLAGVLFGSGQTAQSVALHELPSAVSGFAVGSYVVITPLLGMIFLRAHVGMRVWVAAALALAALTTFTVLREGDGDEISLPALVLTLFAAVMYAVHTLVLGHRRRDAYAVAVIQLGTIAVITGVLALPGGITLPATGTDWALLLHLALIACALGFLARSFGQQHVRPMPAAVILAAQPLWVTAFAVVLYGDPLTWRVFLGGALIAAAVVLVLPRRFDLESTPAGTVGPRTHKCEERM
jgi:Permeases of the drug/metabolite transporter (DMT) superfamily